jgi:4-methyl-5(b-hydroxyethyl)-thiazole monophosphate biosynthesis
MIALLLAPGFEEVEAVTPIDFLRRAGIEVRVVGVEEALVEGSHGLVMKTDCILSDFTEDADGIVIPGGMPGAENIAASEIALELIRDLHTRRKWVAAICAAPAVVLMKAGILEGRTVTCYPGFEERFSGCTFSEERVVVDGNLVTSRGPGTAAEFSLKLIELLAGTEAAQEIHRRTLQKP